MNPDVANLKDWSLSIHQGTLENLDVNSLSLPTYHSMFVDILVGQSFIPQDPLSAQLLPSVILGF